MEIAWVSVQRAALTCKLTVRVVSSWRQCHSLPQKLYPVLDGMLFNRLGGTIVENEAPAEANPETRR